MIHLIFYALAFIGAVALLTVAWLMFQETIDNDKERRFWKKQKKYAQDIALRINSAHYYFSSDPKLFNILFLVQWSIREYGYVNGEWLRNKMKQLGNRRYDDIGQDELNVILNST